MYFQEVEVHHSSLTESAA